MVRPWSWSRYFSIWGAMEAMCWKSELMIWLGMIDWNLLKKKTESFVKSLPLFGIPYQRFQVIIVERLHHPSLFIFCGPTSRVNRNEEPDCLRSSWRYRMPRLDRWRRITIWNHLQVRHRYPSRTTYIILRKEKRRRKKSEWVLIIENRERYETFGGIDTQPLFLSQSG